MKTIVWFLIGLINISCSNGTPEKSYCFNITDSDRCEQDNGCSVKYVKQYLISSEGYNIGAGDISKMVENIDSEVPICVPPNIEDKNEEEESEIIKYLSKYYVLITKIKGRGFGISEVPLELKSDGWKWLNDPSVNFKDESEYNFYCGDGIIGFGEYCDTDQADTVLSCADFPFSYSWDDEYKTYYSSGNITCDASCHWDFSDCH